MATDLYSVDLKTISGSDLYQAISEFTRVDRPADERPREGYLLDFKADVSERFLRSVAAFANTFGGLLIVGVSENDGRPDKLTGVITTGELKTQVASMIASNLFPCPFFEIAECVMPNDPDGKKLCVVRVHETQDICLLARKGEKYPVYVRIEDQSLPVDSSQMRSLIDRKRQDQNLASDLVPRVGELQAKLFACDYKSPSQRVRSDTYFKLVICPYTSLPMRLDLAIERIFANLVSKQNLGLEQLVQSSEAEIQFARSRDWFELQFVERQHDYERRWRLTSRADIGFVTQVRWPISGSGNFWSFYDVAADLGRVAVLARDFWRRIGYYGSFRLQTDLRVGGLRFDPVNVSFSPLFYERMGNITSFPMDRSAITLTKNPEAVAQAELDGDYPSLTESLSDTVAALSNQILRCLGHSSDLQGVKAL